MTERPGSGGHADFELLAWADGRLDDDPARLAAVQARLARDPEAAARARAWRAQTAALRRVFGALPATPTPERHRAVLVARRARAPRLATALAASALLAAGAAGGWLAAHGALTAPGADSPFLDASFAAAVDGTASGLTGQPIGTESLFMNAAQEAAGPQLSLPMPDLSALGLRLTDAAMAGGPESPVVRLTYADTTGETVTVFLRPRPHRARRSIGLAERDGLTLAHWEDGPFASALTATRPAEETRNLARAVRAAMADAAAGQTFGAGREAAAVPVESHPTATDATAPPVLAPLHPPG